jgi:putative transposase
MANSSDYRTGRHCVFNLHVHLVFVAKYRRLAFTKEILEDLRTICSDVCQGFEATWEEFDGERDHVHLLITYPPKVAISRMVNSLKGVSSRLIRKKPNPTIDRALWGGSLWSQVILPGRLEEPHCRSSSNTSSNRKPRIDPYGVRALYLRPERRSFTAHLIK